MNTAGCFRDKDTPETKSRPFVDKWLEQPNPLTGIRFTYFDDAVSMLSTLTCKGTCLNKKTLKCDCYDGNTVSPFYGRAMRNNFLGGLNLISSSLELVASIGCGYTQPLTNSGLKEELKKVLTDESSPGYVPDSGGGYSCPLPVNYRVNAFMRSESQPFML